MAGSKARVPPRWFVVTAWHVQGGSSGPASGAWNSGLRAPTSGGSMRLTTRGRHRGEPRRVIVGYCELDVEPASIERVRQASRR